MRPPPSAQTASICGSCLGSFEPESFAMLFVCQSIWPPSLRGWENQAIFAARSPTAIRDIRPFRLRRKQIPETSRSGTWTTRRTRSRLFFDLPFLAMGEGLCAAIGFQRYWKDRLQYARGKIELDPSPMSAKGHVWTAPGWQELFSRLQRWSVRPCVRPFSAVLVTAGHNALRGSGPGQ